MKKIVLIMMVLALAGSMIFAQDISVKNETEIEFGNADSGHQVEKYSDEPGIGLNWFRNASEATIASDMFTIKGKVRFQLAPVYDGAKREEINYWTLTANSDTKINAYIRPFAGFEFAAGTHLEDSLGVSTIWWDEAQADTLGMEKDSKYWTNVTRYVNAGFMVRYTGVENLTAALVLPTDETISGVAYSTSTEKAAIIPMNFVVGYKIPDMLDAGVIAKINVLGTDAMQFTATGNYLGLPMGSVGAYVTYTTASGESKASDLPTGGDTGANAYDDFMMFGVVANMNFAGLAVAPEVSVFMPLNSNKYIGGDAYGDDVKTGGLPLFAKVNLAYPIDAMTPALQVLYSMGGTVKDSDDDANSVLTFKPSFAYDLGVGTAKIAFEMDMYTQGDDKDGLSRWNVPLTWTMMF